jgi:DNA polymerase-3 subunit gamma/tau
MRYLLSSHFPLQLKLIWVNYGQMAYEVTATRRRPQTLKQLVGQEFVVSTIENSIAKGQIAHAYLFSGPRGTGKTSSARILAKSLNCQEGPTAEPCGVCANCTEVTRGNSLDVIEIDGASNTGVNDIREIKDEVLFAPTNSRYKVYIIDEVHMLSNSAFNALLKTIEEPPPYIIFIFATTEIHKVPATIRSRCQQFNFRLFSLETVKTQLIEACNEMDLKYEDDALLWIAKEGTGSMRDSYTLFDQVVSFSDGFITIEKIQQKLGLVGLDRINELMKLISLGEIGPVVECADRVMAAGVSVEQFLVEVAEYFRNILLIKSGIERESLLGCRADSFDGDVISAFTENQLIQGTGLIFQLYKDVRYSLNQRFELELLLSRLVKLRSYFSAEELLGQITHLKNQLSSGPITLNGTEIKGTAPQEGEKKKSLIDNTAGSSEENQIIPPGEENSGDAANDFFNMFDKKASPAASQSEDKNPDESAPPLEEPLYSYHEEDTPPPEEPPFEEEQVFQIPSSSPAPVGEEWWDTLLDTMKNDNHAVLMGSMSKGTHNLNGNHLILTFPSRYIADSVERDKKYIVKLISQIMGKDIILEVIIEEPVIKKEIRNRDEKVELFLRVFRGTVIEDKKGVRQ